MRRWLLLLFLASMSFVVLIAGCGDDDDDNDNDDSVDDDADDDDAADDDVSDDDGPTEYDYDVPTKSTSPWPEYRRTSVNNGRSVVMPTPNDREPWAFATGKGMFHEPVIDEDGTVYMGSADTNFYAVNDDGTEKWRFGTGEIVDCTALIAADGTIYIPSGDGFLYALNPDGTEKWRFQAEGLEGFITWWEGHISMGPDGNLYAGNDDRNLYAISPAGEKLWTYNVIDQIWSAPAFGANGEIFFGSNDLVMRSLDAAGTSRWWKPTLGPVASSPALNADKSVVYVGSFDGFLHAFDAETGAPLWTFAARDHIYASPAVAEDGTIYIGSADGTLYAVNPDGTQRWAFDILDPIRSSASIDGAGNIYFGGADGRLYALSPEGTKLWSFDATTSDRNDLNGSPAIGPDGVYIGGEAGVLHFVPFGWCENSDDPRCETAPGEDIPTEGALLYAYTNGGSSVPDAEDEAAPFDVKTFRLIVREVGDTIRARVKSTALGVEVEPEFDFRVEVSADGNFFSIIPEEELTPGETYAVAIEGDYLVGGTRVGNRVVGGSVGGSFAGTFDFTTAASGGEEFPVAVGADATSVMLMRRIAVPQPPMMTTFNQIGFDSYNFLLGAIEVDDVNGRFILLAAEGTPGLAPTLLLPARTAIVFNGRFDDAFFSIETDEFAVDVSSVHIVLDLFRASGAMAGDLSAPNLNVYAEVKCANVEFFGPALALLGLCGADSGKMIANATASLEPYDAGLGVAPADLSVDSIDVSPTGGLEGHGYVEATFDANTYVADEHLAVIVLVETVSGQAVEMTYGSLTEVFENGSGHLDKVRLSLPDGVDPTGLKAYVTFDLFPMHSEIL